MDAKAEAQNRWPTYPAVGFSGAADRQDAFLAGAAWALREFGDALEAEVATNSEANMFLPARDLALIGWASEAHHIADGIEEP